MSYKSPVTLLLDKFDEKVVDNIYQIVNHYFVDVDKDELLKALRYDRDQYDRGRLDGYREAKKEIVHCKDCKWWDNDLDDCGYLDGLNYAEPEYFCIHGKRATR